MPITRSNSTPTPRSPFRIISRNRPHPSGQLPPPVVFGAPSHFDRWRDLQSTAILAATESDKRFILQAAPTGFGKSLVYVGQALITGARTCILTSTKGLQTQLLDDFRASGMVDIRGMNSYLCHAASDFGIIQRSDRPTTCEEGPCRTGLRCALRDNGCSYYDAYREAQSAQLVVTNYTYWMTIHKYGEGLGKFDLLVMDEGHNAPDELSDFLSIEMDRFDIESVAHAEPMADGAGIDQWRQWANHHAAVMQRKLDTLTERIKAQRENGGRLDHGLIREAGQIRRVLGKMKSLAGVRGDWVHELVADRGKKIWKFDPVWPAEYAESCLFRATDKVVIFSATIRPKTAEILGIKASDCDFNEYPSSFPAARRPIYHVPTVQMNHRITPEGMRKWVTRIDQIVGRRLDRKGIIHTVSFDRRNFIVQNSEHTDIMVANDSHNTRAVVERFKGMAAPAVLVSPSMTTGWDFPGDTCRYVIVGKLPFLDRRPLIMQARCKSDKEYDTYMTAQMLIQETGRGMRAEDDLCEVLIIDDNIQWFLYRNKHFFPGWWVESFKSVATIPAPLELER